MFFYLLPKNLNNYSENERIRQIDFKNNSNYLLPKNLYNYSEKRRVRIKKL